jgi:hypothetical protein
MKRLAQSLLLLALCASPLRAESWSGLALVGQLCIMLVAILPVPFILLLAWLLATANPSIPLKVLAVSGAVLTIGAPLWTTGRAWPILLWAAAWFAIAFFTYRTTKTARPFRLGAGLTLVAFVSAYLLVFFILFSPPARMIH